MRLFKPNIENIRFPHLVRGPGLFTPIDIKLHGWGFLKVTYPKVHKSKAFQKFKYFDLETITLDVPKDTYIQIRLWNIFGFSTFKLTSPGNNTEVKNVLEPKLPETNIPQISIHNTEIHPTSFKTSIWGGLKIFPIINLGGKLRSNFSIVNRYLDSYQLNRSVNLGATQFPKASHQTNYKLTVDFKSIHLSKDEAANIHKGGK